MTVLDGPVEATLTLTPSRLRSRGSIDLRLHSHSREPDTRLHLSVGPKIKLHHVQQVVGRERAILTNDIETFSISGEEGAIGAFSSGAAELGGRFPYDLGEVPSGIRKAWSVPVVLCSPLVLSRNGYLQASLAQLEKPLLMEYPPPAPLALSHQLYPQSQKGELTNSRHRVRRFH